MRALAAEGLWTLIKVPFYLFSYLTFQEYRDHKKNFFTSRINGGYEDTVVMADNFAD